MSLDMDLLLNWHEALPGNDVNPVEVTSNSLSARTPVSCLNAWTCFYFQVPHPSSCSSYKLPDDLVSKKRESDASHPNSLYGVCKPSGTQLRSFAFCSIYLGQQHDLADLFACLGILTYIILEQYCCLRQIMLGWRICLYKYCKICKQEKTMQRRFISGELAYAKQINTDGNFVDVQWSAHY